MTTSLPSRRRGVAAIGLALGLAALPVALASTAGAALVATVPLATAANYSVLGASAVTNTGPSVLGESLGISPGPATVVGFPPGQVTPPGTTDENNPAAADAQADLTAAYVDAAGRSVDATTTADLANLTLQGGVYAGPSKSPLELSGPLVLDGAGDPTTVFIFQTDSTLITGSSSTVTLINGAQECNVFWQVGSSATLGTGSTFAGNILALSSVTVTTGVTVHGRALARNGAVTLDTDVFTAPTCDLTPLATTTTSTATTPTTATPGDTGAADGSAGTGGSGDGSGGGSGTDGSGGTTGTDLTSTAAQGPGVPGVNGPPKTDGGPSGTAGFPWLAVTAAGGLAVAVLGAGTGAAAMQRARVSHRSPGA